MLFYVKKIYFTQTYKSTKNDIKYILYKNLYAHTVCNPQYKYKNLANNLTSITIGLSCTASILLMNELKTQNISSNADCNNTVINIK